MLRADMKETSMTFKLEEVKSFLTAKDELKKKLLTKRI